MLCDILIPSLTSIFFSLEITRRKIGKNTTLQHCACVCANGTALSQSRRLSRDEVYQINK